MGLLGGTCVEVSSLGIDLVDGFEVVAAWGSATQGNGANILGCTVGQARSWTGWAHLCFLKLIVLMLLLSYPMLKKHHPF